MPSIPAMPAAGTVANGRAMGPAGAIPAAAIGVIAPVVMCAANDTGMGVATMHGGNGDARPEGAPLNAGRDVCRKIPDAAGTATDAIPPAGGGGIQDGGAGPTVPMVVVAGTRAGRPGPAALLAAHAVVVVLLTKPGAILEEPIRTSTLPVLPFPFPSGKAPSAMELHAALNSRCAQPELPVGRIDIGPLRYPAAVKWLAGSTC